MISRKSFNIVLLAVISAGVFLITARRLDDWGWDRGKYHTGQFSPNIIDTLNATSTSPHNHANTHSTATASPGEKSIRPELVLPHPGRDPVCDGFPDTSGIFLVMKTGATESFDKIPMQLMTVLKCLTDYQIFSDLEQRIAGHPIHDSLNTVLAEAKDGNADFDLYRQQKACAIDQDMCTRTVEGSKDAGWNLDKYKNIHMAEKIFRLRPGYDWYVFVDADTYVSWPNLVYMLHRLDPSKERYIGSPTLIGSTPFAHGGSGYVMSGAAMKEFVGKNPGVADRFDLRVKNECCGDYMFAVALSETIGIKVESIWPTINGEKPSTLPFGHNHWCQAIATMHHMNSEEVSEFWEFERRRYAKNQRPLVLKEVYHAFMEPKLVKMREDWDNQSDDWFYIDFDAQDHSWEDWRVGRAVGEEDKSELQKKAHESFDDCARACEEHDECFQFVWQDDCCGMKRSIMLGRPVKKDNEEKKRPKSGWDVVKIKKWVEDQGECKQVIWPEIGP
ncbi:hypothetical protein VMCG_04145 [Cytospora schulzeri]|uniref:N-acetylgalactosaminide beta-1,3-galactosyltransferase n=1 Tax=Cytospora schulzeri TaxID=448051 RepID=A0A423WTA3_9PEZI|nr:hypothetical protein VMCG_04145 [Valsa malicola]